MLSHDQQVALHAMLSGRNCFLSGAAGTGKSVVIDIFKEKFKGNCVVLAPTGIAALNVGGQTIHSFFMLAPGLLTPDSIEPITWKNKRKSIDNVDCIIIDEISMVRSDLLFAIDLRLRQCARGVLKRHPFGGKQIIVCGDFFQLPPVVSTKFESDWLDENLGGEYAFETSVWEDAEFETIWLKTAFRQDDSKFLKMLDNVRHGLVDDANIEIDGKQLNAIEALNSLCANEDKKLAQVPISLCTTNYQVQILNNEALAKIDAPRVRFKAVATGKFQPSDYPTEGNLVLKIGCRVMALCNMRNSDGSFQYVNGDCGTVEDIRIAGKNSGVKVKFDNGNSEWILPYLWKNMKYRLETDRRSGKTFVRQDEVGSFLQVPLRLAYATTIHKSQGMTLDYVDLSLTGGCFAHGQLYTALSRVRRLSGLKLEKKINASDLILDSRVVEFYKKVGSNPLDFLDPAGNAAQLSYNHTI